MNNTEIKTVELIVNSEQARKRIDELSARLETLRTKREQALNRGDTKGLSVYAREMKKIENELDRTRTRAERMRHALSNLDQSTPNELKQTLRDLNKELNSGKVSRGSKHWNTLTKAIRETKDALAEVNKELVTVEEKSWTDKLADWGNKWMGLIQNVGAGVDMLDSLRQTLQSTVSDYADMEEAMAQVRKYTGLSGEEVAELNEQLKAMDTRTSREQLNELAGDAGKLGITAKDKIMDFVDAADKINVALGDDLGAGAVKNVGKLAMLFGEDQRLGLKTAMLSTASVINELSQNSSAAAGYLEEFTARMAGVGKQAGFTQAQIMGFAAVLDENMQQDETSSTAFSQLITKLYQQPAKFAALAGKDLKEFTRLLKEDANGALMAFLSAMKSKGGFDSLAPMFSEMGLNGTRATAVLSSVADKLENVEKMQRLANTAYAEAVSIDNEFSVQNTTVQASLDKIRKTALDMRVELGEKLQPVASHMLNLTSTSLRLLSKMITFFSKHKKAIITVTATLVTYNAVIMAQTTWEALLNLQLRAKAASLLLAIKNTRLYKNLVYALALVEGVCTVAMTLFTKGITAARVEFALFTTTMMKNPLGLIAVLLSTAIALILQFTNVLGMETAAEVMNQKALTGRAKALKDCADAQKSAQETTDQEANRIKTLSSIIHDNTRSIKERRDAINELKGIVPEYEAALSNEGKLTEKNTNAIKDYLKEIKKKALAEAMYDKLVEAMKKKTDADLAAQHWDKAVKWREANAKQEKYQSRKEKRAVASGEEVVVYEHETNPLYTLNTEQLKKNRAKRKYYQKQSEETQKTIDTLLDYAKKQGAEKYLENLIANNGDNAAAPASGTTTATTATDAGTKTSTGKHVDPVAERKKELEKMMLAEKIYQTMRYQQGEISRQEYETALLDIEKKYLIQERDLYKQGTDEWNKAEERRLDLERRVKENAMEWSLKEIERAEAEENRLAQELFLQGEISEEAYQQRLDEIRLAHLRRRQKFYEQWAEPEKADEASEKADEEDQKQQLARRKDYLEKAKAMREEYFKKSFDEQEADEITLLDTLVAQGVIKEEEKEKFLAQIREKYRQKREEEKDKDDYDKGKIDNPLEEAGRGADDYGITSSFMNLIRLSENLSLRLKDGEASWDDYAAVAVGALSLVSASMSAVADLFAAQRDLEVQQVTNRYDAEIQKAGESTKKGKKLEEQKQKEIAKIKTKYNKKQQAIEIAQAVASTALAAVNAYASASKVSWILGPIAAAMALAAGAIQIAAIKKQHAAEAAGYYDGGFTGGSDYRREAGVVHEGEFVASHLAVNNPNVAPVLRLIDHAQRTNTIASLTAADVSRSLAARTGGAPATSVASTGVTNAPTVQVVDTSSARTAEALERLNAHLDLGIHASVNIEGQDGLDRQWTRYQRLKKR